MKANLIILEKKLNNYWKKENFYKKIVEDKSRKKFILHDGPPYANGKVHFGHILNKIIKDVTMKKKNMFGYRSVYLPGWDCHGTPIELKVSKKNKGLINYRKYAASQINEQKKVFKKIGMIYTWKKYYKTMSFDYESKEIKFFMKLYKKKIIKRKKKIVNWCYNCNSSLSEFEIEKSNLSHKYFLVKILVKGVFFIFVSKYNKLNYKIIGISINFNEVLFLSKFSNKKYYILKSQKKFFKDINILKKININIFKNDNRVIIDKNKTDILYSNKKKNKNRNKKKKIKIKGFDVCWRHKCIIYRTILTHWFIKMKFKKDFYKNLNKIKFFPKNSKEILKKYLKDRPDWNITRQKKWGVPICLVYKKNKVYSLRGITNLVKKYGITVWNNIKLNKKYKKSNDTLDVWFDSGITHYTVLRNKKLCKYNKFPADVLIEGVDQNRGWFNSSIITSYLYNKKNCTKNIVTHGFVVDEKGNKMSKSLGNYIDVNKIINKYGVEIIRLYLMSNNFFKNIQFSVKKIEESQNMYRKIRYIIRFMINNTIDFKKCNSDYEEIDLYIVNELIKLIKKVKFYDKKYEFFNSFKAIKEFCFSKLSNIYFEIVKDRLYLSEINSNTRRICQKVILKILKNLLIILSPYLSYTCEEAWILRNKGSIFLQRLNKIKIKKSKNNWKKILKLRKKILKKKTKFNNEALMLYFYIKKIKLKDKEILKLFGVSKYKILSDKKKKIRIKKLKNYKKCIRCWNFYKNIKIYCKECEEILNK
ncbi:class I tRNA ligase family protein [Candidatus Vidania fulgoroideorum]